MLKIFETQNIVLLFLLIFNRCELIASYEDFLFSIEKKHYTSIKEE